MICRLYSLLTSNLFSTIEFQIITGPPVHLKIHQLLEKPCTAIRLWQTNWRPGNCNPDFLAQRTPHNTTAQDFPAPSSSAIFAPSMDTASNQPMTRQQVLDLYFIDARHKLVDIAAFLDRVERAPGQADFRWEAFHQALQTLIPSGTSHAEKALLSFSDPTTEPIAKAPGKGATGAWPGQNK